MSLHLGVNMRFLLLALSVILAVALMGFGLQPQTIEELLGQAPPGRASGRAAIGFVGSDPNTGEDGGAIVAAVADGAVGRVVTVLTEAGPISLIIDENTRINSPSGRGRVLERIDEGLPVRIAVVGVEPLVGDDGQPTGDIVVARNLTIIPAKATREHRRVVVAEKGTATKALAVGEGGYSVELNVDDADNLGPNGTIPETDLPEQGDNAILLIRRGEDDGERVTAVVKAQRIIDRLSDLAGNTKLQGDDPFHAARIEAALERHQDDVQVRLQKVLDRAEDRFKEVVTRAVDQAKIKVEQRKKVRGVVSGLDDDTSECVRRILGRVPVTKKGIPPGQLQRIEVQCLEREFELELTVDPSTSSVGIGDTITITLRDFEEAQRGSVEMLINGEPQTPDEFDRNRARLDYTVPRGVSEVIIQARAKSQEGRTSAVNKVLKVRQDPPPRVEIRTPESGEVLVAGSSYRFTTRAADNGEVVSVDLFVNGEQYTTEVFEPEDSGSSSRGTARGRGGDEYTPVHHGAFVPIPRDAQSVTVRVVATDNLGNIGTATQLVRVASDPAPTVSIVSPADGTALSEGQTITVEVEADDNTFVVSVTGTVVHGDVRAELSFVEIPQMVWRASPYTLTGSGGEPLQIEVTATDDQGKIGTATRSFRVAGDAGPTVSITSPAEGAAVNGGDSLTVEVKADDNGEVVSVTGAITDGGTRTTLVFEEFPQMDWRSVSYTVAGATTSFGDFTSSVPPHVFTGTVSLNGTTAPDGTIVTATVPGTGDGGTLAIEVTATDDRGNVATAIRELRKNSPRIEVVSGVVTDGIFVLLVEQPPGESFTGQDVRFTIGDQEAAQSADWEQGGATELNISAR